MSAKVFITDREYDADYKVFLVDSDYQEHAAQLISPGELVQQDYNANVKVYITDREYDADVKITRAHFPK